MGLGGDLRSVAADHFLQLILGHDFRGPIADIVQHFVLIVVGCSSHVNGRLVVIVKVGAQIRRVRAGHGFARAVRARRVCDGRRVGGV